MEIESNFVSLGKVRTTKEKKGKHIPSKIQADTLFTFMTEYEYLKSVLQSKMISPRYCEEDIKYLKIKGIKRIAYPMKCFCDINMHRLEEHLSWYGYYGVAFTKEWGMKNCIQPIQYINPNSALCKDFSKAFSAALKMDIEKESKNQQKLKDFLLHTMMYYKPYEGKIKNRNTGKEQKKCFTDECEWRYIPDVTTIGFEQAYYDETIFNAGILNSLSNAMNNNPNISLEFAYSDLKYIIVKNEEDFGKITEDIVSWKLETNIEHILISKIIIWDQSKGDF